jgi:hypothetical protein
VTLFKNSKIKNYFIKKSNISIFNTIVTQIVIKDYHLKVLKSVSLTLVNISLKKILVSKKKLGSEHEQLLKPNLKSAVLMKEITIKNAHERDLSNLLVMCTNQTYKTQSFIEAEKRKS